MSCNTKGGQEEAKFTTNGYIPKAPARAVPDQAMAISPPGGRCTAIPRGGKGSVVDDISGSGSPVLAVCGRVVGDRGSTRR